MTIGLHFIGKFTSSIKLHSQTSLYPDSKSALVLAIVTLPESLCWNIEDSNDPIAHTVGSSRAGSSSRSSVSSERVQAPRL